MSDEPNFAISVLTDDGNSSYINCHNNILDLEQNLFIIIHDREGKSRTIFPWNKITMLKATMLKEPKDVELDIKAAEEERNAMNPEK